MTLRSSNPILLLFILSLSVPAQNPPASDDHKPTISTTVQEVVLDLIVRDKRGKAVQDIGPGDVVVTENGVEQRITSVRLISGVEFIRENQERQKERKPLDVNHQIRLITLAFDRLGTDGRRFARQGALDLLKLPLEKTSSTRWCGWTARCRIIQNFTNDRDRLRAAVERVTSAGSGGGRGTSREAAFAPPLLVLRRLLPLLADPALGSAGRRGCGSSISSGYCERERIR